MFLQRLLKKLGKIFTKENLEQIIMTNLGEERKSESYGIISFFRGIGLIPTGILGGLIVENIHYIAPFIFSAVGVIIELFFLLIYFRE